MKVKKIALSTLITVSTAVFSSNVIANNTDALMPYVLSAAEKYIVPKLSRDLGKNIQVKSNPHKKPSLELVIPNATCEDYFISASLLSGNMYIYEHILDKYEEDKTFTKAQADEYTTKPGSTFSFVQGANAVLGASIVMNPDMLVGCGHIKQMSPEWEKKVKSLAEIHLTKKSEKLKAEGRF